MHRSLTVKEVLIYQANLRLPSSISQEEKKRKVNEVCRRLNSCIVLKLNNANKRPVKVSSFYITHFTVKSNNKIETVKSTLLIGQVLDLLDLAHVKNTKIGDEVWAF